MSAPTPSLQPKTTATIRQSPSILADLARIGMPGETRRPRVERYAMDLVDTASGLSRPRESKVRETLRVSAAHSSVMQFATTKAGPLSIENAPKGTRREGVLPGR